MLNIYKLHGRSIERSGASTHTLTSTTLKNFIYRVGSRAAGTILNKVTTRLVTSRTTLRWKHRRSCHLDI